MYHDFFNFACYPVFHIRQRHKWQYLVKDIEQFAKDEGCKMMELIARPGWQKVLNNYGYQRTHVVLEKKIKQEEKK